MEKTERENEMDLKSRLLRICKNLAKNEHVSKFFRMFSCVASNHGAQKTVSLAGPSIQPASQPRCQTIWRWHEQTARPFNFNQFQDERSRTRQPAAERTVCSCVFLCGMNHCLWCFEHCNTIKHCIFANERGPESPFQQCVCVCVCRQFDLLFLSHICSSANVFPPSAHVRSVCCFSISPFLSLLFVPFVCSFRLFFFLA